MKNNNSFTLVFIAGLGHSGSTLFDLLLGTQKGITGLGEIDVFLNTDKRDTYFKRFEKYPCTCGKEPLDCLIWSSFKEHIDKNENKSYGHLYKKLIEIVLEKTDSNIIVDSSKNIYALKSLYQSLDDIGIEQEQFCVIHLVKDVRSYSVSSLRSKKRESSTFRNFRKWKKTNEEIEDFLEKNNIRRMTVGYDELILSTRYVMNLVLSFLDVESENLDTDINKSKSHIISGNNMRLNQADGIYYDYRWFLEPKIQLYYSLIPFIKVLNHKWVYGNVKNFLSESTSFKIQRHENKD